MICQQCEKNEIIKLTKLKICQSCYIKNYRKKYPEKYYYKYGGIGPKKLKIWSRKYKQCIQCGTIEKKHYGKGLCESCYNKKYDMQNLEKIKKRKAIWYQNRGKKLKKKMKKNMKIKEFKIFIPNELHQKLKIWAITEKKTMKSIIVDVLEKYLKGKLTK